MSDSRGIRRALRCVEGGMSIREFTLALAVRVSLLMVLIGVVGGVSYGATHWEPQTNEVGSSAGR